MALIIDSYKDSVLDDLITEKNIKLFNAISAFYTLLNFDKCVDSFIGSAVVYDVT